MCLLINIIVGFVCYYIFSSFLEIAYSAFTGCTLNLSKVIGISGDCCGHFRLCLFAVRVLLAGISSAFRDWSVMHVLTFKCLVD